MIMTKIGLQGGWDSFGNRDMVAVSQNRQYRTIYNEGTGRGYGQSLRNRFVNEQE